MPYKPKKYVKDNSNDPIYKEVNKTFYFKSQFLPSMLMAGGIVLMGTQVVWPLISYKANPQDTKPLSQSVLGAASGFREFEFGELQKTSDGQNLKKIEKNLPKYFYITIPKLGIKDALIETNSTNLSPDESLGHYNGTSLPGEVGTSFIYGHSVLPVFYNPKNYKTIFSTLDKLEEGDTFTVKYNNNEFEYKVLSEEILKPNKVNPLAKLNPDYLGKSNLILMTCYPAGTKDKRLLVNAELISK